MRMPVTFCAAALIGIVLDRTVGIRTNCRHKRSQARMLPGKPQKDATSCELDGAVGGRYGSITSFGGCRSAGVQNDYPSRPGRRSGESSFSAVGPGNTKATDFEYEDLAGTCKPSGFFRAYNVAAFQLVASPEKILMTGDAGGGIYTAGVRRIYMNRPHLENPPLTFFGDSVGHWEGDTLVIDTIGFNDNTWLGQDRSRHSNALHIVERMRFVANGEYLEHIYVVDDPFALTSPFTMTRYHKKMAANTPVEEKICGENPDGRRSWAKLFNRIRSDWDDIRKTMGMPAEAKTNERK